MIYSHESDDPGETFDLSVYPTLLHPFVRSDSKPEPSDYPALAAFDIKGDRKSKFPVLLLAIATVCRTIANARLQSELIKGVSLCNGKARLGRTPI
jgi:hypothetical protein